MRADWIEISYKEVVNKISTNNKKLKQKEYLQKGAYPVIDQGQELVGGYTDDEERLLDCELPAIVFGDHTKIIKLINFKFAPGADGTKVLEPKTFVLPKYLSNLTQILVFKIKDKGYARHYQHIEKQSFPLAPLPEQRAIVAKIEQLFSELDNGIANLKAAKDKLEIYRQAVLKKAFEGDLTSEWREKQNDLPTADELTEQIREERLKHYENQLREWEEAVAKWEAIGKQGKKPSKPKKVKELSKLSEKELKELAVLPKEWNWAKIDMIQFHEQHSIKAGPFGSSLKKSFYVEAGYKIYGQEQVIGGDWRIGNYYIDQRKFEELRSCAIQPKDVLISLVGTVGKVLVLPDEIEAGIINPRLIKITLAQNFYNPFFFKYYFESAYLKSLYATKSHGATMDIINLGIIQELPFPLLSVKEQNQIIQEIESRLSVCDNILANIEECLEKSEALRQSILKKAFEGKLLSDKELEACRQEPDWEPAEQLLERIKNDKAVKA